MLVLFLLGNILEDSHDKLLTENQTQNDIFLSHNPHTLLLLVQQHMGNRQHFLAETFRQ